MLIKTKNASTIQYGFKLRLGLVSVSVVANKIHPFTLRSSFYLYWDNNEMSVTNKSYIISPYNGFILYSYQGRGSIRYVEEILEYKSKNAVLSEPEVDVNWAMFKIHYLFQYSIRFQKTDNPIH